MIGSMLLKTTKHLIIAAAGMSVQLAAASVVAAQSQDWEPVDPPMLTRWAKDIDPKLPLPEHPRPQMMRDAWQNLNGLWEYAVTQGDEPDDMDGHILVPYPIESSLSGVKREFTADDTLWYKRTIDVPADWDGKRVMLNFGAVDYRTEVVVNGKSVGIHQGGYDPFSFDITDALTGDENEVVVKVTDPTWTEGIPRGKQTLSPAGIMYTPTSGIWQTVWMEAVSEAGVEDLHMVPSVEDSTLTVTVDTYGDGSQPVMVAIMDGDKVIARGRGGSGNEIEIEVPGAELWTPDNPHLYDVAVSVLGPDDRPVDSVKSYVGMRSVALEQVDGVAQLMLNGEPIFHFGPLDQGFWPDGVYTAPTDEALRYDLEVTKELGFNMTRKHIKVEPARWYYHADQLGLLVWQDMPSINSYDANQVPSGFPEIDKEAFERELRAMIDNLENHPSIVMWVIFNESQGQHDTAKYVDLVRELDPSRIINQASGGRHDGVGDVYDHHPYPAPRLFEHPSDKAFALGEYGGIGLKASDNNPWQDRGWGYTNVQSGDDLENLYARYADLIREFKEDHDLTAAVYTQITDVEIEVNGLLTYDRELKVDPEWIAKANRFEWAGPTFDSVVATSKDEPQSWQYTFTNPGTADWAGPDFDDSGWQTGDAPFGDEGAQAHLPINSEWTGDQIWMRRTFTLDNLEKGDLERLRIASTHDDEMRVYINGVLAFEEGGARHTYEYGKLSKAAQAALKFDGDNVLAVTCIETGGDQQVDVGLAVEDANRN